LHERTPEEVTKKRQRLPPLAALLQEFFFPNNSFDVVIANWKAERKKRQDVLGK
jgi:hypothetical protein